MGSQSVMFKAEVDIDGREITRSYLERIDIQFILEVCTIDKIKCRTKVSFEFFFFFLIRKFVKLTQSREPKLFCWNTVKMLWIVSVPKSIVLREIYA